MKTFCEMVGEALRRRPGDWVDRWSVWIIAVLGTAVLGIMVYAWWTAER